MARCDRPAFLGLLVYCADYRCSHHVKIDAGRWPDDVRRSDLEPLFVCQICCRCGADVRPCFDQAVKRNAYSSH